MTSPQTTAPTDPQSIIAALQQRLDAALSEKATLAEALATRNSEFGERIEQQAATIEVLEAMSASPGDTQPIFDLIARQAVRLCNVQQAAVSILDGTMIHLVAQSGFDPAVAERIATFYPRPLGSDFTIGRAIINGRAEQVEDVTADPGHIFRRAHGAFSNVAVPMLRDGKALGAVTMGRWGAGRFSDSQVQLLRTFAEQAAIAITSAETYRALQTRTSDLQEALEYQTATSDVLKVISRTEARLDLALETLVATAARICAADQGAIHQLHDSLHFVSASFGTNREYRDYVARNPIAPGRGTAIGRMALERRAVHIEDVLGDPEYTGSEFQRLAGFRSVLAVPLFREDVVIGSILLTRSRVEPFTDKQIELVRTFADQAVIAIENARLITETREALERQTATAEVLQVINASPGDLVPVFDAMLEKAMRLCEASYGELRTYDGQTFHIGALRGVPENYAQFMAQSQADFGPETGPGRVLRGEPLVHILDLADTDNYRAGEPNRRALVDLGGARTVLLVPLRKDEEMLGLIMIYRTEVRPFTDKHIALLQNFAAQAVIAMENARLINETHEALEQQTATSEVLRAISASPDDAQPVFELIARRAKELSGATAVGVFEYDGALMHHRMLVGYDAGTVEQLRRQFPRPPGRHSAAGRAVQSGQISHIRDTTADPDFAMPELEIVRSLLGVPLLHEGRVVGAIALARSETGGFGDTQVALVQSFAEQAVIAINRAETYRALQTRTSDLEEALEYQTATSEVLNVISRSTFDLEPVFQTVASTAVRLCNADQAGIYLHQNDEYRWAGGYSQLPEYERIEREVKIRPGAGTLVGRVALEGRPVQVLDAWNDTLYEAKEDAQVGGIHTLLGVPLLRDGSPIGVIGLGRQKIEPFTERQIELVSTFAAQAVIAMENARLLNEVRQRQEELRVTFENMGDGVAMFDETQHLVAWNRKFQDILDVPDDIIARRQTFSEYVRYLAERGEYRSEADPEEHVRRLIEQAGQSRAYERTRPDGRVIEIRNNPVPDGGFVLIFSDITERKRSEAEIRAARDAAEEASRTIEAAYRDLKAAQANLIQAEKMASLGQLTAGIAHEIKNPLNFVNNFSALSTELIDELRDVLAPEPLGETARTEVDDLTALLKGNLEKVVQHGQRADGIVRSMLDHSRGSSGERRMVDLNALIDEALNLAYHGARAQDQSFNITLEHDFGVGIAPIEVNPQDITRVFLNLFANGFYATTKRARDGGDAGFVPTLKVTTIDAGEAVEVRVRDNGTGVPIDIRDKLFQPFFTTKPTGEGTGLGLSITYDIVTQQHGGSIAVDSEVGEYSEFTIRLPRRMLANEGGRAVIGQIDGR